MQLDTNHFHSDGGRGWDFTVSEIFFPASAKLNHFSLPVQELEYFFSNSTFQYNGNSVETFFLSPLSKQKRNFNIIKKKQTNSPPFSVRKWLVPFMILI